MNYSRRDFLRIAGLGAAAIISPYTASAEQQSDTGVLKVKLNLPKASGPELREDFSGYTSQQIYGRVVRELETFSQKIGKDIVPAYTQGGIIYWSQDPCGPCRALEKEMWPRFVEQYQDKLLIVEFHETMSKDSVCCLAKLADYGTPTITWIDSGKVIRSKQGFKTDFEDEPEKSAYMAKYWSELQQNTDDLVSRLK